MYFQHLTIVPLMPKRILSVSYDESLLATRQMLLQKQGYSVTSALGFTAATEHCKNGGFDLFILGHSIPFEDKVHLMEAFRSKCSAPILSLDRHGEDQVSSDFHASPFEPAPFLKVVDGILSGRQQHST
jgi:DNA-binding response OmpR family regulator